jgi:hypothetical protein
MMKEADRLNADAHAARLEGLDARLMSQGRIWRDMVIERCPHLFANVPVYISFDQLQQMTDLIAAIERVVNSEKWQPATRTSGFRQAKGVFYGYDFHLNSEGAHLIEINTNAGGGFMNLMLQDHKTDLPGVAVAHADLEELFMGMFKNEWRLERGYMPLACLAIIDEHPEEQYLYPEFLLVQRMFEREGIRVLILDPSDIRRSGALFAGEQKIDMVYNRLTDFSLQSCQDLLHAWREGKVVLTPNPDHYARYADKRNLVRLTDEEILRELGVSSGDIATLQAGIPHAFLVKPENEAALWEERRKLYFKPASGYGSRGAYRGDKLTKRVFGEILNSDYIAQQIAQPGERCVEEGVILKYDLRCYVYEGNIQLMAARLYQGQATNFRTPRGGFAPVRVVG